MSPSDGYAKRHELSSNERKVTSAHNFLPSGSNHPAVNLITALSNNATPMSFSNEYNHIDLPGTVPHSTKYPAIAQALSHIPSGNQEYNENLYSANNSTLPSDTVSSNVSPNIKKNKDLSVKTIKPTRASKGQKRRPTELQLKTDEWRKQLTLVFELQSYKMLHMASIEKLKVMGRVACAAVFDEFKRRLELLTPEQTAERFELLILLVKQANTLFYDGTHKDKEKRILWEGVWYAKEVVQTADSGNLDALRCSAFLIYTVLFNSTNSNCRLSQEDVDDAVRVKNTLILRTVLKSAVDCVLTLTPDDPEMYVIRGYYHFIGATKLGEPNMRQIGKILRCPRTFSIDDALSDFTRCEDIRPDNLTNHTMVAAVLMVKGVTLDRAQVFADYTLKKIIKRRTKLHSIDRAHKNIARKMLKNLTDNEVCSTNLPF